MVKPPALEAVDWGFESLAADHRRRVSQRQRKQAQTLSSVGSNPTPPTKNWRHDVRTYRQVELLKGEHLDTFEIVIGLNAGIAQRGQEQPPCKRKVGGTQSPARAIHQVVRVYGA